MTSPVNSPAGVQARADSYSTALSLSIEHKIPADLLFQLGCSYNGPKSGKLVVPPTGAETDVCVGDALLSLLPAIAGSLGTPVCSASSVITGLFRGACWRSCLNDECLTYDLAAIMLDYAGGYFSYFELEEHASSAACSILNDWLKPDVAYAEVPGAFDLARNIFGASWCFLMLKCDERVVGSVIHKERPPFLPGLCPAQDGILSAPLPDDIGFSA